MNETKSRASDTNGRKCMVFDGKHAVLLTPPLFPLFFFLFLSCDFFYRILYKSVSLPLWFSLSFSRSLFLFHRLSLSFSLFLAASGPLCLRISFRWLSFPPSRRYSISHLTIPAQLDLHMNAHNSFAVCAAHLHRPKMCILLASPTVCFFPHSFSK